MESLTTVNTASSFKGYILATIFLILAVMATVPSITLFQGNRGCEGYLNLAKQYNFTPPESCFAYSFQKYIIPSVAMASPFLFIALVLLLKERKKQYQLTKPKQEKIAFWLLSFVILTFLLSFVLIKGGCEGFGCLALGPLIAAGIGIFSLLVFGFSLWFLGARYQWSRGRFLAVTIGLVSLLVFAYFQATF